MRKWTKKVFKYLDKAIMLDSNWSDILKDLKKFGIKCSRKDSVRSAYKRAGRRMPKPLQVSPQDCPQELKDKCLSRAYRHFIRKKNIKHRVTDKNKNKISFKFNRYSTKYPAVKNNYKVTVTRYVD